MCDRSEYVTENKCERKVKWEKSITLYIFQSKLCDNVWTSFFN